MKRHLTERELIEYQFKLASDIQMKEIAEHLEGCARCREDLEQLKHKFAALDFLREEPKVSEDLISRVVEQTKSPVKTKIMFGKPAWIGAAAAVLLIGFLTLIAHLNKQTMPEYQTDRQEFAKEPKPTTEAIKSDFKTERLLADRFDESSSIVSRLSSFVPVEEQPPFAPASAIELVVLPRREKVQLTIYNSTFQVSVVGYGGYGRSGGPLRGGGYGGYAEAKDQPGDLATLIQETIEPDSWFDYGGEGTIQTYDNKKLIVLQTTQTHQKIKKLLQVLRAGPGEQLKSEPSSAIGRVGTDSVVYKQLDQIVDLSTLIPTMPFSDAIDRLKNSVETPLKIVVLWRDLRDNAEIGPSAEINMDGISGVRLGTGLENLLRAVGGGFVELGYVIEDGVITIATVDSLPSKMETRVYDISDLGGIALGGYKGYGVSAGITSDSRKLVVEKIREQDIRRRPLSRRPGETPASDLTLVREKRNLTLKRGWNWLQFMWANTLIDPTSLSLETLEQKDKIYIQQLVFPARLRELGRWLIHSEITGQVPFEITYFTSGLSWRAFYMGTLTEDEKTMWLQGYVRVANNSGEDYENAQTRLIVGQVHLLDQIAELARRQYPYDRPEIKAMFEDAKLWDESKEVGRQYYGMGGYGGGMGGMEFDYALRPKEIIKEGLSEYFLYTIEGTETIPDKWSKRLISFQAEDVPVKSLYKYDQERWGKQTTRFVSFANDEEHNLGETPIPNGQVKIYNQADEQGYLSYVGGTEIKYIPVNEEIELNLGPARLVSVEPVLMNYKKENFVFDRRRNITGWDEIQTWKIKITNTRTLPIEIEITRRIDAPYWTLHADIPYEKHDARRVRFKINLEPHCQKTFEYTVRIYHGERKEVWQKVKNKS